MEPVEQDHPKLRLDHLEPAPQRVKRPSVPWAPTLTILLIIGGVIMIRFSDFTLAAADTPSEQDATSVGPAETSVEDSLLPQIVYRGSVHGSRGTPHAVREGE